MLFAWTWLPAYPRISRALKDTVGCRTIAELPWDPKRGTIRVMTPRTCTLESYCNECIGHWSYSYALRLWDRTACYSRCRKLPDAAASVHHANQLRRRLEKLVYYMRVGLDLLGTSASPALPSLAHVGVFCRRLGCENKDTMLT
jgi:hypothetical protein